jgi:hypothetical protein
MFLIIADWRPQPKRVTAERGSDLSLSCTFQDEDSDKTVNKKTFFFLFELLRYYFY